MMIAERGLGVDYEEIAQKAGVVDGIVYHCRYTRHEHCYQSFSD